MTDHHSHSVTFPDGAIRKGCLLRVDEERSVTHGWSWSSTVQVNLGIAYFPVKAEVKGDGGTYISFSQSVPVQRDNDKAAYVFWERRFGGMGNDGKWYGNTSGELPVASSKEECDRIANAISHLIELCGGKRETF